MSSSTTSTNASLSEIKIIEQINRLNLQLEEERRKNRVLKQARSQISQSDTIICITNRLPLSLKKSDTTGRQESTCSSGGLVSALSSLHRSKMKQIGWTGVDVPIEEQGEVIHLLAQYQCVPVFLSADIAEKYYNGFSNDVIWPLYHYVPIPIQTISNTSTSWRAYQLANQTFCDVILRNSEPTDVIQVHDYHLMLLPQLIRANRPICKIGQFLHTPFPSSEIYRTVPNREEILKGLLASNLVGFHIYDYARHFKSACGHILGCEVSPEAVKLDGKLTEVGTFPIGIDSTRFQQCLKTEEFKKHYRLLKNQFGEAKVIVGIDRLDYVKGIPHKLFALEKFFRENPEQVNRVTLVQIAIPSRGDVKEYQRLAEHVHELVGRINGQFSNMTHAPIHYMDRTISFEEMVALYNIADCCLITSLRDGMNLVSYEYVASQNQDSAGVLILSEFSGAAQSLGAGSIRINPQNIDQTASAIRQALSMSNEERQKLHQYARKYVSEHTSQKQADDFISHLSKSQEQTTIVYERPCIPPEFNINESIRDDFAQAQYRVLFLGIVGTLTTNCSQGMLYKTYLDFCKMSPSNCESLTKLTNDPSTVVVLVSSRKREFVDKVVGRIGTYVCAENGFFQKLSENFLSNSLITNVSTNTSVSVNSPNNTLEYEIESGSDASVMSPRLLNTNEDNNIVNSGLGLGVGSVTSPPSSVMSSPVFVDSGVNNTSSLNEWKLAVENVDLSWIDAVEKVMKYYVDRTPLSFIEKHESYISQHYRDSNTEQARRQARDLVSNVGAPLLNTATEIIHSQTFKTIQVRPVGFGKSMAISRTLHQLKKISGRDPDFVMCLGNFYLDEDAFGSLNKCASDPVIFNPQSFDEMSSPTSSVNAQTSTDASITKMHGGNLMTNTNNIGENSIVKNSVVKSLNDHYVRNPLSALNSSSTSIKDSHKNTSTVLPNATQTEIGQGEEEGKVVTLNKSNSNIGDTDTDTKNEIRDSEYVSLNLPNSTRIYTISVGSNESLARSHLKSLDEVEQLLRNLANALPPISRTLFQTTATNASSRSSHESNSTKTNDIGVGIPDLLSLNHH